MLTQFLTSQLFTFLLIFCRVGSALMLLPGFGEAYIPVRGRLFLAAMFSLVLSPLLALQPPESVFGLLTLIVAEIVVGIFFGVLCRILISAVHMASMIIAYQSNLASSLVQDVTQIQSQSSALGNLLSMAALLLIFVTHLHHTMLKAVADSYGLFVPGHFPPIDDFAHYATQMLSGAFAMAMQMAGPFIVVGILINLVAGVIARLMPGIQIFFLMTAPQIMLSFFILMISFSAILLWYLDYFKNSVAGFLAP